MCTMITVDSTIVYSVINRVPPVIVCYKSGTILLDFSPKLSLLYFNLLRRCSAIWTQAQASPQAHLLLSLKPDTWGTGVILQADSDPGRHGVGPL